MSFIKKISHNLFLSTFIFLLAAVTAVTALPALTFAQTPSSTESPRAVAPDKAPIIVKINNISYAPQERLVSIDYTVTNNTNAFADTLKYNFEFYNGDKLAESGLIFRDLKYVLSTAGEVPKLSPNQSKRETIEYVLPESIPGGPYFIRGVVSNNTLSLYGVDYTKESINLTGLGRFITTKTAALLDVENKQVYNLMEGPTLEKDGEYLIAFPKEVNEELFSYLENGEIYSDLIITHTSNADEVVFEKKNISLNSLMNEERTGFDFKIEPWEGMRSGSHTALITFNDERGIKISENMTVRLLYRGLMGRIYDVSTNINSYRKGEPANLLVNVLAVGDPDAEKVFVTAKFKNEGEVVQEIQKEVKMNKDFKGVDVNVDFSDEDIKTKSLINEVEVSVLSASGVVLDTQSIDIDTTEIFEYPKETNIWLNTLIGILILIGVVAFLAFVKRKNKISLVNLITGFAIMGSALLLSYGGVLVFAQEEIWCWEDGADNYGEPGECMWGGNEQYSEDGGDEYCQEYGDSNYNQPGPCMGDAYNEEPMEEMCYDPSAINYEMYGPCEYSDAAPEEEPTEYGCKDAGALNYRPEEYVLEDNSLCEYSEETRCWDTNAANYEQEGECWYHGGCTDPGAANYDPAVMVDDGSCIYDEPEELCENEYEYYDPDTGECIYSPPAPPELTRDLIHVSTTENFSDAQLCTETCVDMTYYLRIQCKDCLNAAHEISVSYFNNWNGSAENSQSDKNIFYSFDKESYPSIYSYWIVYEEDLEKNFAILDEIKASPESKLAGWPIAANDIINQWVFGPFVFPYCSENFNEDGTVDRSKYNSSGKYNQSFAIEINTSFGGDYCEADVDGVEYGPAYEVVVDHVSCDLPAEIRASFYLDHNADGTRSPDELYLKASGTKAAYCLGETSPLKGLIQTLGGDSSFGNLIPDNCSKNIEGDHYEVPYFRKDFLNNDDWKVDLDPENAFGFVVTGIQYYINSEWVNNDFVSINSGDMVMARVGVQEIDGTSISCAANPELSKSYPFTATYNISNFISDEYDIEDLTFEWTEVNANKPQKVVERPGSVNNGRHTSYYNEGGGEKKDFIVDVVAKNNEGEVVSNTATCTFKVRRMTAICQAFPSLQAIPNSPQTYFDQGQAVYWHVTLEDPDAPIQSRLWQWDSTSSSNTDTVGPFRYHNSAGKQKRGSVMVRGITSANAWAQATCYIMIKACSHDSQCPVPGEICSPQTFTCVAPPPVFTSPLTLNPSVVNTGEQCRLRWTVDSADYCTLYKNGEVFETEGSSDTDGNITVDPGTYSIICESEGSEPVTGGPVRCLANPDIREQ